MRASLVVPPTSESELVERVRLLAGQTISEIAATLGITALPDPTRHKGFVGSLIERALGADAGSSSEPDFTGIGVELKTLPIGKNGRPSESTFVCTAPLSLVEEESWRESRVRNKLARVLFVPVEGDRELALAGRRVGTAWLWSPSEAHDQLLADDWEEIAGVVGRGGVEALTAHVGRALQVRPKAANSRVRTRSMDDDGLLHINPRGFYLRASFTASLLDARNGDC